MWFSVGMLTEWRSDVVGVGMLIVWRSDVVRCWYVD